MYLPELIHNPILTVFEKNEFPIPEIIFDPTLVLSPHVFLQGMLFKAQAFKSPNITSPEKLYSLKVLEGLNEQKLPLKEELDDEFIFCQGVREAAGVRIAREIQATTDWMRYRRRWEDRLRVSSK